MREDPEIGAANFTVGDTGRQSALFLSGSRIAGRLNGGTPAEPLVPREFPDIASDARMPQVRDRSEAIVICRLATGAGRDLLNSVS